MNIQYHNNKQYYYFPELENKFNVFNMCMTQKFGNINHSTNQQNANFIVSQILKEKSITDKYIIMSTEGNNQISIIDEQNYFAYLLNNTDEKNYIRLFCDCIIINHKIPVIVSPADCMIILVIGYNHKANSFIKCLIHVGFVGSILNLHIKSINFLKRLYLCNAFEAFIFPYIFGEHYIKNVNDQRIKYALELDKNWRKYFVKTNSNSNLFNVYFANKVKDDLRKLGVDIYDSNLDTYTENQKGNLYSLTYLREHNMDTTQRFGILIY
ncbi:MAG: laccase domain-containing protein [Candidatus Dojkabacteria bacterium]|nr:laccase domain-containing protein [Candidatus Dojkabacteria bacterium]